MLKQVGVSGGAVLGGGSDFGRSKKSPPTPGGALAGAFFFDGDDGKDGPGQEENELVADALRAADAAFDPPGTNRC